MTYANTDSAVLDAIQDSIRYLNSEEAHQSIDTDVYWPKWNSPWWHMAVLHEMDLAKRIPHAAVEHMAARLKAQLAPAFFRDEVPAGKNPMLDVPCPCQLGNIYQILSGAGVDMDQVLPWARSWFLRYQMPDGGLSCDEDAYKARPPASSIVGTIAPLEAILYCTSRPFTPEEEAFLDRGADCLIQRKLMLGCQSQFNADERLDEEDWLKPCFPRFYFYDVLRGLRFVLHWAERRRKPLPFSAISGVTESLRKRFPDGEVRIERHSFEGVGTRFQDTSGDWQRRSNASSFPLLEAVSRIGQPSPYLSEQWRDAESGIERLTQQGLIARSVPDFVADSVSGIE